MAFIPPTCLSSQKQIFGSRTFCRKMHKNTDKRKPNKLDEENARHQKMALRDIERAIEIAMNSGVVIETVMRGTEVCTAGRM